ncbi:MAG: SCO family protein [Bacteroidetes bacterium]|nr:SCO family protein [Bacteroidota bacterium]HET6244561.1 SCO family protein [Bacteroidia bacterium]
MRSSVLTVIAVVIIVFTGSIIAFNIIKPKEKLKIFKLSDINPKMVDENKEKKTGTHRIAAFELISQQGIKVTEKVLENKIYVADFFFTTCPSICPAMSAQMKRVNDNFKDHQDIMLVSHSVMPEIDTPEVLQEYAQRYGALPGKWLFLTGDKKDIYALARQSYFAVTTQGDGDEHDFIHTENLILVDKEKRIRGFYDGTDKNDVNRLISEIDILKKEYIKE